MMKKVNKWTPFPFLCMKFDQLEVKSWWHVCTNIYIGGRKLYWSTIVMVYFLSVQSDKLKKGLKVE